MSIPLVLRLLLVMVLWSLCFPLIAAGLALAPHLAFAALRAAIAGLTLLAIAVFLKRSFPQGGWNWAITGLIGLGSTTLGFLGMFHAAEFVSPGMATVIANAQPILAALLAALVLGERMASADGVAMALGFAGIVTIAVPAIGDGVISGNGLGVAYIVLAAIGISVGNVGMKLLSARADALPVMGLQLLFGAVPLALLSAATEDWGQIVWSTKFVLVLSALAFLGTALAFSLWFSVLGTVELHQANAFTFLVPIFGLALGAAFFGERPSWPMVGGAALVVLSIVIGQLRRGAGDRR